MKSLLAALLLLALVSAASSLGNCQSGAERIDVRVEVTTAKKQYAVGEPVVFRVVLVNTASTALYIPKSFGYLGGGIPGFALHVKQLTGKPAKLGCVAAGDAFGLGDSRSPEQLLKEEYLRLSPGGLVGFEDEYRGCGVENAGRYEITADYSPAGLF